MSFQTEIEAITGSISSYTSEANLYLVEGVKFVSKYVMNNPEMAERMTTSGTAMTNNNGLNLASVLKVVSVVRYDGTRDREALEVPVVKAPDYLDSNSIYYTSKYDPKYYITNGTLKVIPIPTASEESKVRRIDPDTTVAVGDVSVDNFPDELERGVVLYASKEMLRKLMSTKNSGLPSDMTIPTLPTTPALLTLTLDNLGTAPSYTQTVLSLTNAPSISDLSVSASAPTTPTLSDTIIGGLGTAPGYSKPSITGRVSFEDFIETDEDGNPLGDSDPGVFSTSSVPTLNTSAFIDPSIGDVSIASFGTAPTYTAPVVTGDTQEITGAIVAGAIGTAADFLNFQHWYDVLADMIETEEDTELAQAQLGKIQSYIQAYQSAMQNQLNEFNEANVAYQADVQKKIEQARITARDSEQTASLLLQKEVQEYQAKVSEFQAQVNKDVQVYSQKLDRYKTELSIIFQTWQATQGFSIQQYQTDIQNELNDFNKEVTEYQANLQIKLAQAKIENTEESQLLQKYQSEIQVYSNNVQKEIQQYQANLEKELQLWINKRNTELAQYQADIQDELNKFNEELQIYQTDLTHKIKKADLTSQEEALNLQKYGTEIESYGQQINKEMQNFATKLQKITTDYQWLQGQYSMVTQDLISFLQSYLPLPELEEVSDEVAANDRYS